MSAAADEVDNRERLKQKAPGKEKMAQKTHAALILMVRRALETQ